MISDEMMARIERAAVSCEAPAENDPAMKPFWRWVEGNAVAIDAVDPDADRADADAAALHRVMRRRRKINPKQRSMRRL